MVLYTMKSKRLLSAVLCLFLILLMSACGQEEVSHFLDQLPSPPTSAQKPDIPETSPEPAPTAESPQPELTPEPEETPDIYLVKMEGTPYRSAPKTEQVNVLGTLSRGTKVECVDDQGEFMLIELEDGQQVWCGTWYLEAEDPELAQQRAEEFLKSKTNKETFVPIDGEPVYNCTATVLNCRAEPSTTCTILYQIVMGTQVTVLGRDGDFYLCRLPNGGIAYCSVNYLSSESLFVDLEGAVDLRVFMPGAEFEMLFASPNNITGKALYPAIPLLEEKTACMLMEAYNQFREDGYTIKIYDAYRPKSAQYELFDIVGDSWFIADPYSGNSWHQLGRAVDMSLVDLSTGEELEMPTPMHTFSMDAARSNSDSWTEEAKKNVEYMTSVMQAAGFDILSTEWWHFEYTGPGGSMDNNLDFSTLSYRPVSEYVPKF